MEDEQRLRFVAVPGALTYPLKFDHVLILLVVAIPYALIALIASAILGVTLHGWPPLASDPLIVAMVRLVYFFPRSVLLIFFPGLLFLVLVMYVTAFAVKVLNSTIRGRDDIPGWPDLRNRASRCQIDNRHIVVKAVADIEPPTVRRDSRPGDAVTAPHPGRAG